MKDTIFGAIVVLPRRVQERQAIVEEGLVDLDLVTHGDGRAGMV